MEDFKRHAQDFLQYAADEGYKVVRKSAKSYWDEDIYHDTIIRVYEIIMKKKTVFIKDFGYYLKRAYYCQMLQARMKADAESRLFISAEYSDDIYNDICESETYEDLEDRYQFYDRTFYQIVRYVFENYSPEENEIWRMKRLNNYTYAKIEEITGINFYRLQKTVAKIDKDIKKFDIDYE